MDQMTIQSSYLNLHWIVLKYSTFGRTWCISQSDLDKCYGRHAWYHSTNLPIVSINLLAYQMIANPVASNTRCRFLPTCKIPKRSLWSIHPLSHLKYLHYWYHLSQCSIASMKEGSWRCWTKMLSNPWYCQGITPTDGWSSWNPISHHLNTFNLANNF